MNVKQILVNASITFAGVISAASLQANAPDIVARVGTEEIQIDEIRALLPDLAGEQKLSLAQNPDSLNELVRTLIIRQIVLREAVEQDWQENPSAQKKMERARETALVESYLEAISTVPSEFPSEEQVRNFYQSNLSSFTAPAQYKLRQIFFAITTSEEEGTARSEAESVLEAIRSQKLSFADAAVQFSDETASAQNGGVIGWVSLDNLQPALKPAIVDLTPGEITDPIELADGLHLVQVEEIQESMVIPFDEVQEQLATRMRAMRAQANRRAYLSRLIEENPVAINEIALSRLLEDES